MNENAQKHSRRGFTLIEVMGALVVFSLGILMILGLTGVLNTQMDYASLRGQVATTVQNRLDSLQVVPYDSLSVGTTTDAIVLNGKSYNRTHRILQVSAMVKEMEVTVAPADGTGPSLTASGFVSRVW